MTLDSSAKTGWMLNSSIEGGPRAVQSLASGEVQFALVAGAPVA